MSVGTQNLIVKGVKNGVISTLEDKSEVSAALAISIRDIAVTTIQGSRDLIVTGIQIPASIVKGATDGLSATPTHFTEAIRWVVDGAVQGALAEGILENEAVSGAVQQALFCGKALDKDLGVVALESVQGAISAVQQTAGDMDHSTKDAVMAALEAAKDIGSDAEETVKQALADKIAGAKEIIA
jgi:hypothetical protein